MQMKVGKERRRDNSQKHTELLMQNSPGLLCLGHRCPQGSHHHRLLCSRQGHRCTQGSHHCLNIRIQPGWPNIEHLSNEQCKNVQHQRLHSRNNTCQQTRSCTFLQIQVLATGLRWRIPQVKELPRRRHDSLKHYLWALDFMIFQSISYDF